MIAVRYNYRSRRRSESAGRRQRPAEPFIAVFDASSRSVYVDSMPTTVYGMGALLDALLDFDRPGNLSSAKLTMLESPKPNPSEGDHEQNDD